MKEDELFSILCRTALGTKYTDSPYIARFMQIVMEFIPAEVVKSVREVAAVLESLMNKDNEQSIFLRVFFLPEGHFYTDASQYPVSAAMLVPRLQNTKQLMFLTVAPDPRTYTRESMVMYYFHKYKEAHLMREKLYPNMTQNAIRSALPSTFAEFKRVAPDHWGPLMAYAYIMSDKSIEPAVPRALFNLIGHTSIGIRRCDLSLMIMRLCKVYNIEPISMDKGLQGIVGMMGKLPLLTQSWVQKICFEARLHAAETTKEDQPSSKVISADPHTDSSIIASDEKSVVTAVMQYVQGYISALPSIDDLLKTMHKLPSTYTSKDNYLFNCRVLGRTWDCPLPLPIIHKLNVDDVIKCEIASAWSFAHTETPALLLPCYVNWICSAAAEMQDYGSLQYLQIPIGGNVTPIGGMNTPGTKLCDTKYDATLLSVNDENTMNKLRKITLGVTAYSYLPIWVPNI